ncbi:YCF48-related protein [Pseudomonas sp. PD9R]|uniref:YCF48-related protein n=1 Tax=Pseudomonas sp. PD9R TaxID=2853534 RepID=UPI001C476708|nr:YCF48-related protein [Pseudomonas sp. PD9R]MBV6822037.1 glycosyl hydrolase [Pseudomonas sp. PD9R]
MTYLNFHDGRRLLRAIWLGGVLGVTVPAVAQSASLDLLDTPATLNQRAEHAVLLAVTRAGDRLVAVGEQGIVLLSDDNAVSWRQSHAVPSSVALTAVSFIDAADGWAVGHGGVIVHSSDGGETWRKQLDGKLAAQLELQGAQAQSASDPQAGQRRLNAAQQLVADGADKPFLGVYFADPQHGLVVGAYGLAMLTDDAGVHWRSVGNELDNPGGLHLYSVLGDSRGVMIAGEQGTLLRGSALGQPFSRVQSPYHGTWFGAVPVASGQALVFGLKGNAYRLEEGSQWQSIETSEHSNLTAGKRLADGSLVVVSEGGRVLHSRDQGRHFQALQAAGLDGSAITDVTQAADGALVLTGARGIKRLNPMVLTEENAQ